MKENEVIEGESIVKNLIDEFTRRLSLGDADGLSELFSTEIDWFVPGSKLLPWTGQRFKREDVSGYFKTMWPHFVPGKSESILESIVISGNEAVVFGRFKHSVASTGRSFETEVALHFTVRNEKIIRMHFYEDTKAVHNAFFD